MAIAFVNGYQVANGSGTSGTVASTAQNHSTGNAIIVFTSNYTSGTVAVTGVADTAGNSYSRMGAVINGDGSHQGECWAAFNIAGNASNVVTATFAATADFRCMAVLQYSGVASASAYDAGSTGSITASSTTHSTSSVVTANADDVILGSFIGWAGTGTISGRNSSVLRTTSADNGDGTCELIVSSTGTYTVDATSSPAKQFVCFARAFKAAIGIPTPTNWTISDFRRQPMLRGPY